MATAKVVAFLSAIAWFAACGADPVPAADPLPTRVPDAGPTAAASAVVAPVAATGCQAVNTPGCGGCACEACVCAVDPYCCQTAWDAICVGTCSADCGTSCPGVAAPGCSPKAKPGCGGCGCEQCVCAADPYCCATAWDDPCAKACKGTCGMDCETTAGAADVKVQINPDTGDPHLFTVQGGGTKTWVFGTKTPDGAPQGIEKAVVDTGKDVTTLEFDASKRPTRITDSTGRSMTFSYSATDLTIVLKEPGGVGETQMIPLDKLPADFPKAAPAGFGSAGQGLAPGDRPITVVTHVRIVQQGKTLQDLVDAQVIGSITNKTLKYPGAYDPGQAGYVFQYVHRTQPLDLGKDDCLAKFGTAADLATYFGGITALATGVCLFTPAAPICAFLAAKGTTLALAGVSVGGALSTLKSKTCDDLVIPPDPAAMSVTVAVQHPSFGAGTGSGAYDIGSALDPINKSSKVEIFVDYEVKAAILAIGTVPAKPAAKQSYQFRFEYLPPGADIEWKVTGTDKFATGGLASGGAGGTTALTTMIPGGAKGIQDTVEAWLVIGGQKLAYQTWNFTFQ